MIHASVELVEAMRGVEPMGGPSRVDDWPGQLSQACDSEDEDGGVNVFAADEWPELGDTNEPSRVVDCPDCPDCLALMAEARGPERTAELLVYADHLEGVVAAYETAKVECPECPSCGARFDHVALQFIACTGCDVQSPYVATKTEAAAIIRCLELEPLAAAAKAKLATIRAANLFTPGESAARRKTA